MSICQAIMPVAPAWPSMSIRTGLSGVMRRWTTVLSQGTVAFSPAVAGVNRSWALPVPAQAMSMRYASPLVRVGSVWMPSLTRSTPDSTGVPW